MASVKQIIRDIKEQKVATTGRRVLLVEGTDDVTAFQNFLSRKFPAWEQDWILAPAGSKKNVLEALALEANWLGVVDRDAWTDVQIAEKRRNLANLLVLPRFCIESYLIAPEELWLCFSQNISRRSMAAYRHLSRPFMMFYLNGGTMPHFGMLSILFGNGCALPVLILRFMILIQHRMMLKLNNAYGSGASIWIPMSC